MNQNPNTPRVVLFVGDMNEQLSLMEQSQQPTVSRSQLLRVDSYEFSLQRSRNNLGVPYGASSGNRVLLTVSVGSKDRLKVFYERLSETTMSSVSLVFDAKCDEDGFLIPNSCEGIIVMEGYVVDIDERYDSATQDDEEGSTIDIQLLLNGMCVVGSTHNLSFSIN